MVRMSEFFKVLSSDPSPMSDPYLNLDQLLGGRDTLF